MKKVVPVSKGAKAKKVVGKKKMMPKKMGNKKGC